MSDLDLKIKITADNKTALDAFVNLSKKLRESQKSFADAEKRVKELAREIKNSDAPSKSLQQNYAQAQREVSKLAAQTDNYRDALKTQSSALKSASVDVDNLKGAYADLNQESQALKDQKDVLNDLGKLDVKPFSDVEAQINGLNSAYQRLASSGKVSVGELAKAKANLKSKVSELRSETGTLGTALDTLKSRWLGVAASITGGVTAISQISQIGRNLEALKNQFIAVTGSAEEADKMLEFVRNEAKRLGLEANTLASGFVKMAAAAKGTALQGAPVQKVFSSLAETFTVMQLSATDTDLALNAIVQMMSKGVVSAEEFRQQLGERLPQANQAAADALGVTTAKFAEMLENGEIIANDFLPKFAEQLSKTAQPGLANSLNSTTASFNRLGNALSKLAQSIAPAVNFVLGNLADALTFLIDTINNLNTPTKIMLGLIASVAAGLAAWQFAIAPLVALIGGAFTAALGAATAATGALAIALNAIPYVAIATLLVYLGAELYNAATATDELKDSNKELAKTYQDIGQNLKIVEKELDDRIVKKLAEAEKATESVGDRFNDLARNIENSFQLRSDTISETLQAQLAEIEQGGLSERDEIKKTTQAVIQAERNKLAEISQAAQRYQAAWQSSYGRLIEAAKAAGQDTKAIEQEATQAKLDYWSQLRSAYQSTIDALITEEQRHLDAVRSVEQERLNLKLSVEDRIREITRKGMSDYAAYQDRLRQIDEKQALARQALTEGDYTRAKQLADETISLAERTAQEVTRKINVGGEQVTQTVVSQNQAAKRSIEQIKESARIADDALKAMGNAHQDAAEKARTGAEQASASLDSVAQRLETLQNTLSSQAAIALDFDISKAETAFNEAQRLIEQKKLVVELQPKLETLQAQIDAYQGEPVLLKNIIAETEAVESAIYGLKMQFAEQEIPFKLDVVSMKQTIDQFIDENRAKLEQPTEAEHIPEPNLSLYERALNILRQPTSSTHTVYVQEVIQRASGGLIKAFAGGGKVTGPGTATSDSIPAMLSAGEFVVQAKAVNQYGAGFLNRLNQGLIDLPKFATGGYVMPASNLSGASATSAGASGSRDMMDLRFIIGTQTHTVQSSRDTAMALANALRDISRAG